MGKIPVTNLNYFGDNTKQGFIGLYVDEGTNAINVYLRCNLYTKFNQLARELQTLADFAEKEDLPPSDIHTRTKELIREMSEAALSQRDKKRFIFGSPEHIYKNYAPDITHVFGIPDVSTTSTYFRQNIGNVDLSMIAMFYHCIFTAKKAMTSLEGFVEAINIIQHEHIIKQSIRFIEELIVDESSGYVY